MGKRKEALIVGVAIGLVLLSLMARWYSMHLVIGYHSGSPLKFRSHRIGIDVLGSSPDRHVYGTHIEIGPLRLNYLENKTRGIQMMSENDY